MIHEVLWEMPVSGHVEVVGKGIVEVRPGDVLVCNERPCGCCDDVLRVKRRNKRRLN